MLPKVNSWRDAGDTPGRKNHQEEAKLQHFHTTSPCIASPCHVKWRNQEGASSYPAWETTRNTAQTPTTGLYAEELTPYLLRLKLYCI
jgi:hypothetical protein